MLFLRSFLITIWTVRPPNIYVTCEYFTHNRLWVLHSYMFQIDNFLLVD